MLQALLLALLTLVPLRSDRFVVDFPAQAAVTQSKSTYRAQVASGGSIYMLIWVANPDGAGIPAQKALDATMTTMVRDAGITLTSKAQVKVAGKPGYEFRGRLQDTPCWGRITIVKERAYLLLVAGGQPGPAVQRFYRSFKLL